MTAISSTSEQHYRNRQHSPSAYRRSTSYSISSDEMVDSIDNGAASTSTASARYPTSESHLVHQPSSSRYNHNMNNEQAYNMTQYQRSHAAQHQPQPYPQSYSRDRREYTQSNNMTSSADYYSSSHPQQQQHNGSYYTSPTMSESDMRQPSPSQFGYSQHQPQFSDRRAAVGRNATTGTTATTTGDSHFEEEDNELEHKYGYGDKGAITQINSNTKLNGGGPAGNSSSSGGNKTGHANEGGVSSIVRGYGTPHQIAYLSVVLVQTLATAAMIAVVWAKIRAGTPCEWRRPDNFLSPSSFLSDSVLMGILIILHDIWCDCILLLPPCRRTQPATMDSAPSSQETTTRPHSEEEQ